jgi:nucleotide-binding universal stress UspA family protein
MDGNFRMILALIDYTPASLHAAEEAALIAWKFDSELHLLHVSSNKNSDSLITHGIPSFEQMETTEDEYNTKVDQLEEVKTSLKRQYNVKITGFEHQGEFVEVVKKHVKDFSVDLVVLGAKKRGWLKEIFIESKAKLLIKYAESEVLCVHCESKTATFKKIVLPVGKSVSKKKMSIAYELAKKFASNIHLIALNKQEKSLDEKSAVSLIASYRYLRDNTNMPIACNSIVGKNLADAAMHYAEVIEADLILIDEGAESDLKMALWRGKIFNHSLVTVMSVQSNPDRAKNSYRA